MVSIENGSAVGIYLSVAFQIRVVLYVKQREEVMGENKYVVRKKERERDKERDKERRDTER